MIVRNQRVFGARGKRILAVMLTILTLCGNFLNPGLTLFSRAEAAEPAAVWVHIDMNKMSKFLGEGGQGAVPLEPRQLPSFGTGEEAMALDRELMNALETRLRGLVLVEVQRPDANTAALIAVEPAPPQDPEMTLDSGRGTGAVSDSLSMGFDRLVLIGVNTSDRDYLFHFSVDGGSFQVESATIDSNSLCVEPVKNGAESSPLDSGRGQSPTVSPPEDGTALAGAQPHGEEAGEEAEGGALDPVMDSGHRALASASTGARGMGLMGYHTAPLQMTPGTVKHLFAGASGVVPGTLSHDRSAQLDSTLPPDTVAPSGSEADGQGGGASDPLDPVGGALSPGDRAERNAFVASTQTISPPTPLSARMLAQLTGTPDPGQNAVLRSATPQSYSATIPPAGFRVLDVSGFKRPCTVVPNVTYFPVNLYDYNRDGYNEKLTQSWSINHTDMALFGGKEKHPGGNYGYPDNFIGNVFRDGAATKNIVANELRGGQLVFENRYNNAYPLFPTPEQAEELRARGLVEETPTPKDYAGTGRKLRPYSEFRFDYAFPFLDEGGGYYSFDSEKYHVDQVMGPGNVGLPQYALHEGVRGNPNGETTFCPFVKDSVVPYGTTKKWESPIGRYFGMSMSLDFLMPEGGQVDGNDMVFQFRGDDDMWVFVDSKLVLDIGGGHHPISGSINFHKKSSEVERVYTYNDGRSPTAMGPVHTDLTPLIDFTPGTKHTLQIFYLERFGGASNCFIRFNVPKMTGLGVTKRVEKVNGFFSPAEANRAYGFYAQVDGKVLRGQTYVAPDGSTARTDPVTGVFWLRDGETAVFPSISGGYVQVFEKTPGGYTTQVLTKSGSTVLGQSSGSSSVPIPIPQGEGAIARRCLPTPKWESLAV